MRYGAYKKTKAPSFSTKVFLALKHKLILDLFIDIHYK